MSDQNPSTDAGTTGEIQQLLVTEFHVNNDVAKALSSNLAATKISAGELRARLLAHESALGRMYAIRYVLYDQADLTPWLELVERRIDSIRSYVPGLSIQNVRDMIGREPLIIKMDYGVLIELLKVLETILTTHVARERFLYAYPDYFTLELERVRQFAKSNRPLTTVDLNTVWKALNPTGRNRCIVEPRRQKKEKLVAVIETDSTEAERAEVQRKLENATHKEALESMFGKLGFVFRERKKLLIRVKLDLRSYGVGLHFMRNLQALEWHDADLEQLLRQQNLSVYIKAGTKVIENLQFELEVIGLSRHEAIQTILGHSFMLTQSQKQRGEKLQIICGEPPKTEDVLRLFRRAAHVMHYSPELLQHRCSEYDMMDLNYLHEPELLMQNPKEVRRTHNRTAAKNAPASHLAALIATGWKKEDAKAHLRAFPGIKTIAPVHVLDSLRKLREHLSLRNAECTKLLKQNCTEIVQTYDALCEWNNIPSATHVPSTPIDLKLRADQLIVSVHDVISPRDDSDADVEDEFLNNDPVTDAIATVSRWLETARVHAKSKHKADDTDDPQDRIVGAERSRTRNAMKRAAKFLHDHPELLSNHRAPLQVAYGFEQTFGVQPYVIGKNLYGLENRAAIIMTLPRDLYVRANEQRQLAHEYANQLERIIGINHLPLFDPCRTWSWFFTPIEELEKRWEIVVEEGAPSQTDEDVQALAATLHLRSRTEFREQLKELNH